MSDVEIGVYPLTPAAGSRIPSRATRGAAGWDIKADLKEDVCLEPGERMLIPTGIALEIPEGYEGQIRPRSGWAQRTGVTLLNSPGTIDSDYRGEVKILLINLGKEPVWIRDGDRIAQLVFAEISPVRLALREEMSPTKRGEGGFGHTGR